MKCSKGVRVLVTGGTGYLGQFLIAELSSNFEVVFTFNTTTVQSTQLPSTTAAQCNLTDAAQVQQLFSKHGPFVAVINTAALSQPGVCQDNPEMARAINVPSTLLSALQQQAEHADIEALLIHVSTDQVYDGSKSGSIETAESSPINEYGISKLEAETAIQVKWRNHIILRSSIIYGPQPASAVSRPLFVQFVEESLQAQRPTKMFADEYRNPILVHDISRIVAWLLVEASQHPYGDAAASPLQGEVFNMGGPDRLSRLDIAHSVAAHFGYSLDCVESVSSASVVRAAPSPLDISMNSSKLRSVLPFQLTSFKDGLGALFGPSKAST